MSLDDVETRPATLNPLYLQAALDEAELPGTEDLLNPIDPAIPSVDERSGVTVAEHSKPPPGAISAARANAQRLDGDEIPEIRPRMPSSRERSDTAIYARKRQIEDLREEIEKLETDSKAMAAGAGIARGNARLNELRLKRLSIQMALVAGSGEYGEDDLLALDRQIAEHARLSKHEPQRGSLMTQGAAETSAMIEALRNDLENAKRALRKLMADRYVELVATTAEDYIESLKAANDLRHKLLALAALAPHAGPLRDIDLGGEFPTPRGLGKFNKISSEDLAISNQRLEENLTVMRAEFAI